MIVIVDRFDIAYILLPILGYKFLHQGWDFRFLDQFGTVLVGCRDDFPKDVSTSIVGVFMTTQGEFQDYLFHVKCTTRLGMMSV